MDISFIDVATSMEVYRVTVSIYSSGSEYSGYYFEGRVNNCIYNTAYYIKEKLEK